MAPPPAIQTFLSAPEQNLMNSSRPHPAAFAGMPSSGGAGAAPKFQSMSGLKRGASWSDDEDVDDDDDDLDDLDDLDGAAGGSGGATGASGGGDDGAGGAGGSGRRVKNPRKRNSTSTGRRKIDIGYIESKAKRHVSFSKRKAGLMKKGYELSTLTGTECLILVVSETGLVYTYATPHLRPIVELDRGREFIGLALKGELTEETAGAALSSLPANRSSQPSSVPRASNSMSSPSINVPATAPSHPAEDFFPHELFAAATQDGQSSSDAAAPYFSYSVPQLFPSMSTGLTPYPHEGLPSASVPPPPPPPPQPDSAPSPLQTALSSHAAAFELWRQHETEKYSSSGGAINSKRGAHQFSEEARNWKVPKDPALAGMNTSHQDLNLPVGTSTGLGDHEIDPALAALGGIQPSSQPPPTAHLSFDERRKVLRAQATQALLAAKDNRSLPDSLRAHRLQIVSMRALPPQPGELESSLPLPAGIETTMSLFTAMCAAHTWTDLVTLRWATQYFLEQYLPARQYSSTDLYKARQHLTLFFDYLEGHELITTDVHTDLTSFSFNAKPATPAPTIFPAISAVASHFFPPELPEVKVDAKTAAAFRGQFISEKLRNWVSGRGSGDEGDLGRVDGAFEIYRIRTNFILLKQVQLDNHPKIDPSLSPFKVRMPRDLTPHFKIDDRIDVALQRVPGRSSWVPIDFNGFHPTLEPDAAESDIDPSQYSAELDRLALLSDSEEKEESIQLAKEVLEMLTRARNLLDEGEEPETR